LPSVRIAVILLFLPDLPYFILLFLFSCKSPRVQGDFRTSERVITEWVINILQIWQKYRVDYLLHRYVVDQESELSTGDAEIISRLFPRVL